MMLAAECIIRQTNLLYNIDCSVTWEQAIQSPGSILLYDLFKLRLHVFESTDYWTYIDTCNIIQQSVDSKTHSQEKNAD